MTDDDARAASDRDPQRATDTPAEPRLPVRERLRWALAERLPGWARGRCGVEPRAVAAVLVVLVIALGFAVHHYWNGRPQTEATAQAEPVQNSPDHAGATSDTSAEAERRDESATDGAGTQGTGNTGKDTQASADVPPNELGGPEQLVIDVAGDVAKPGVITLPAGSRVSDAIEAAGGVQPDADTTGLNRARPLADGEHVVVGGEAEPPGHPAPADGVEPGGAVSINAATEQQLEELPGVGPVLATSIVSHRTEHGPFTAVDQLLAVSGIGDTRLADLRDRVVL